MSVNGWLQLFLSTEVQLVRNTTQAQRKSSKHHPEPITGCSKAGFPKPSIPWGPQTFKSWHPRPLSEHRHWRKEGFGPWPARMMQDENLWVHHCLLPGLHSGAAVGMGPPSHRAATQVAQSRNEGTPWGPVRDQRRNACGNTCSSFSHKTKGSCQFWQLWVFQSSLV